MVRWYWTKGRSPALTVTLEELARLYLVEGAAENVRGDVAFCQAIHETGWFGYGGQVQWWQNNYCGLGATNPVDGQPIPGGETFNTAQIGVRAHIQHLCAYLDREVFDLAHPLVDPRYTTVIGLPDKRAETWVELNGKWAFPGTTYGQSILAKWHEMRGA